MKTRFVSLLSLLPVLSGFALLSTSAQSATAVRTFIASTGNDVNACSRTAPCRTFGAAIAQTDTGGEVIVLDSAGYGPVTITKSVSLLCPAGIIASISVAPSADGITVNGTDINVVLRGLSLVGQNNNGENGINFLAGRQLNVENCSITGFNLSSGIHHSAVNGTLIVDHTRLANANNGIEVTLSSPSGITAAKAYLKDCRVEGNTTGIACFHGGIVVVSDTNATRCTYGFYAQGTEEGNAHLSLWNCVSNYNITGVEADGVQGMGYVRVANSLVTQNGDGLVNLRSGNLISVGGNVVEDNKQSETFPTTHTQK